MQNLLDMTRLGHGALSPRRAPVELAEIVGRVRTDLARLLSAHHLAVEIPHDLPMLNVDPVLIGQALTNVFENAAKYAPSGTTITVAARVVGTDALVSITDEGPGIPDREREKVFDLFHRVTEGDARPAGTGLGLAIVRGLVEAHGGTASALAGPNGRGATIVLRLPLAAAPIDDGT